MEVFFFVNAITWHGQARRPAHAGLVLGWLVAHAPIREGHILGPGVGLIGALGGGSNRAAGDGNGAAFALDAAADACAVLALCLDIAADDRDDAAGAAGAKAASELAKKNTERLRRKAQ